MFHIAGDRLSVDADAKSKMNSTWLLFPLNSIQTNITNSSFTKNETMPEEEEDMEEEYEDGWYNFQLEGKAYMACILFIALVGVAGNVMSFILMMDRKLNSFAYSIYIKWMAVSDSVLLVMVSTEDTLHTYGRDPGYVMAYDVILCKLWYFIVSVTFILSPWLVVALTLDRFVCVVFPLSRHVLCTKSKAIKLCLTLTLVAAALNIDILIFHNTDNDENLCQKPHFLDLGRYGVFMNIVVKSTLPCAFVLVLNIVTISRIRRSLSFRKQFTGDTISKAENEREDKVTLPLLLVSGFAFVTLLPITVTEAVEDILDMFQIDEVAMTLASNIWPICNVIYLMNFAQNFYILLASWPEYRMIIKTVFSPSKGRKTPPPVRTKSSQSSSTEFSETCVSTMAMSGT